MTQFSYAKLEIFIPEEYVDSLRDALNSVGVGRIGNYDHCIAVSRVQGYWRPLPGAEPYQGEIGEVESGEECKVEVSCRFENLDAALQVIGQVHPYDKPLINILPLLNHQFPGVEL
jgi:hypothetical protein